MQPNQQSSSPFWSWRSALSRLPSAVISRRLARFCCHARVAGPSSSLLVLLAFLSRSQASAQDTENSIPTNAAPETVIQPSNIPFFGNAYSQPSSASGNSAVPPAAPLAGTSQLSGAPPLSSLPPAGANGLAHWEFIYLFPHINYQVSYGNSLQSSPGQPANTVINEVSPGILIKLGEHWTLDYTPTLRYYSSRQLQDGVDHVVNLTGATVYNDWNFGFSQVYSSTSQPLIETASQLSEEVYSTSLRATHSLGSKFLLDLGLNQNFRYIDEGQQLGFNAATATHEWSTMDWVDYKYAPSLDFGIGTGFTYDNVSVGSDMTSEPFQGRIRWSPTSKLTFALSGGAEYRQFLNSDVPNLLSPIFSGSAQYHLFEYTTFSLSASRSVMPSYFADSISENTSITAALRQRLLGRLFLDVSGGYTTTSYQQSSTVMVSNNPANYDVASFNVRLSTAFLKRASAGLFFQENFVTSGATSASAAFFNYTTTQYGLSLSYHW